MTSTVPWPAGPAQDPVSPVLRRPLLALGVITLLAGVLRLATLDVQSVWLDEGLAIRTVRHGFGSMLGQLDSEQSTPPLYYVLAWVWTRVLGTGVVPLRAFSAVAGTVTVPLLYLAGRHLSVKTGLWAATLGALSPLLFYYAQEARPYALLVLFATAAQIAWQRALDDRRSRDVTWWAVFSVLALLTHYFAVFLFIGQAVVLARRHGPRLVVVPVAVVAAVGASLVPLARAQGGNTSWIGDTPLPNRVAEMAKQFVIGPYGPLGIVLAPIMAALFAAALVRAWRQADRLRRRRLLEIGTAALLAVALPLVLAVTGVEDVFKGRNLVAAWPSAIVLVAAGLETVRASRSGLVVGACLCAGFGVVIAGTLTRPEYGRDDWRGVARGLSASPPGQRRLVLTPRHGAAPLGVYLPSLQPIPRGTAAVSAREVVLVYLRSPHRGPWGPGEDALRAPLPPGSPRASPRGFEFAGRTRTKTYAIYRFRAAAPRIVDIAGLRRAMDDPRADVVALPG